MPPIIAAVVALYGVMVGAIGATLTGMVLSLGASLVLGQISKLWQKGPSASSLTSQIASRSVISRAFHED